MKIVNNAAMLKSMEKEGHIKLHPHTGKQVKHWSHQLVVCYYVDHGKSRFTYNGKEYGVKYFDGCYYPFVVLLDGKPGPSFV